MDKSTIKIGSYQGPVVAGDFDANMRKVREVIESVQADGLDFLCFPETFLSGYDAESVNKCAVTPEDPRIQEFLHWSARFDTVFLVGFSERAPEGIYNSQLVAYQGKLLGIQHKTMLTAGDKKIFVTDLELPVFEAKGIKFGICICHTTSYPEPAQILRMKGARLLFTPHWNDIRPYTKVDDTHDYTYYDHRNKVLLNQAGLASLLKMVVVRSNIIHIDPDHLGSGDSNIWDMDGRCVAAGRPFVECVVSHEFEKKIFLTNFASAPRGNVPLELFRQLYDAAVRFHEEGMF